MSRWFRAHDDALDDPKVQRLPDAMFKANLLAALRGEVNEFSPFIQRGSDRPSGPTWAIIRSSVFKRDDFTCAYCGERGGRLECDHVIPVSRGGSSEPSNLTTACFACNRSKRDKTPEEWRQ